MRARESRTPVAGPALESSLGRMHPPAPILLVSSDPQLASALEAALGSAGYRVLRVALAHQGAGEGCAGMLSAVVATVADGSAQAVLELKECVPFRGAPVLAVLGRGAGLDAARALGAHDFVMDGSSESELLTRLEKLLEAERMRRALSRLARDSNLALELTRTLASSVEFHDILFTVVRRIHEVVRIDRVSIVLTPDDEPGTGYVIAASDDQGVSNLRLSLAKYPEIQRVLFTKQALTINDVSTHPLLDGVRESVPSLGALSLIPILFQDRVIGLLFMRTLDQDHKLTENELEVCTIIANATSGALRNAHLMQKLRRDHREAQQAQNEAEELAARERESALSLRKTKDFLESLIEASVDAIVAADLEGTIILYNKGAERIYGYNAEEVVGKLHVGKLYPEGVAKEVMRRIRSPEYGGTGRLQNMHSAAVDKAGNVIPISLSAAMIYEHGKPTATVGIFTDLREKLLAEERLAQVQKKLEVSEKQVLLAELAGTAAHELNQPLTSVMGYGELLIRRLPAGTPERNAAQVIMQEAERMANLVRKIGKITRYETKSYVGDQRILDLDRASDEDPDTST
jgi:PAS domain S-box-containing protein